MGDPNKRLFGAGTLTPTEVAVIAEAAKIEDGNIAIMVAIACAESSLKPTATNSLPAMGLWQINMEPKLEKSRLKQFEIKTKEALLIPVVNAGAARKILETEGLGAWDVYDSGAYKQYMEYGTPAYGMLLRLSEDQKKNIIQGIGGFNKDLQGNINPNPDGAAIGDAVGGALGNLKDTLTGGFSMSAVSTLVSTVLQNIGVFMLALLFVVLGFAIILKGSATKVAASTIKQVIKK